MREYWNKLATKIDGMTLRERVIIFSMLALVLVTLVNSLVLDAMFARQKQLSQEIRQQQAQVAGIQADIQQRVTANANDPDAATRQRMQAVKAQAAQLQESLRDMQKGLVSPDKMGQLLEDILKRNSKLRVVSLKKLPVSGLMEATPSAEARPNPANTPDVAAKAPAQGASGVESLYKHGVEITVQGSYLDMMNYMADLEAMSAQLFWGRVKLNVDEYPTTTLTLTLFTLSMDKKWLNI
jgi:MSHA biogenesis protein MshJ